MRFFWVGFLFVLAVIMSQQTSKAQDRKVFDHPLDDDMVFYQAGSGGNCTSCIWIVAEGKITRDTPAKFEQFLKQHNIAPNSSPYLHINSPGGSLLAGMQLGEIFRKYGANIFVAKIRGEFSDSTPDYLDIKVYDQPAGICASACVYALLGGVRRYAVSDHYRNAIGVGAAGKIAVHQFYVGDALVDFDKKIFSGADRSDDQLLNGILLEYVVRMGGKPSLLTLASQTRPTEIHIMTDEELRDSGIENAEPNFDAKIIVFAGDAASVVVRHETADATVTTSLFCNPQRKLMLYAKIQGRYKTTAEDIANWKLYDELSLTNGSEPIPLYKKNIDVKNLGEGTAITLLFQIGDDRVETFARMADFEFSSSGGRYAWLAADSLSFKLPKSFGGMSLLPRACMRK